MNITQKGGPNPANANEMNMFFPATELRCIDIYCAVIHVHQVIKAQLGYRIRGLSILFCWSGSYDELIYTTQRIYFMGKHNRRQKDSG